VAILLLMLRAGAPQRCRSLTGPGPADRDRRRSRPRRRGDLPPDRHRVRSLRGGVRLRRLLLHRRPCSKGRLPTGGGVGDRRPRAGHRPPVCACRPIVENGFSLDEVPPSELTRMVKLVSGRLPDQSRPTRSCWAPRPCGRWVPTWARRCAWRSPDRRRAAGRAGSGSTGSWGPQCPPPTSTARGWGPVPSSRWTGFSAGPVRWGPVPRAVS